MTAWRLPERWLRESGRWLEEEAEEGLEKVTDQIGGPARRRAVLLLACVVGLDSADKGAIGAIAPQLEHALHIGTTKLGLLVTVSSLVGALATIPVGALTDRTRRVRLLLISIVMWAGAQAVSGLATGYLMLLVTRLALGAVTATAGPTVASLTGDFFPGAERSRMYGFILSGELVGAGLGIAVAGGAASILGWRAAFFALAVPTLALPWFLKRMLPEPARGGQSRIAPGDEVIASVEEVRDHPDRYQAQATERPARRDTRMLDKVVEAGVEPAPEIVVSTDPTKMSIWRAIRYVLQVRTNIILIVASSLGYFFFAGLRTFAVVFVRGQFGISEGQATFLVLVVGISAIAGVLLSGRYTDRLIGKGRIDSRILAGIIGFVSAAIILAPAMWTTVVWIAVPLFCLAGAAISAPNPALDAARLDVIPARLWGRGEGVRTFMRNTLEAFAPLTFGFVSQLFGGGRTSFGTGVNSAHAAVSAAQTHGLEMTFLVMLVPLAIAGVILLKARETYPVDVRSAAESERRSREAPE